MFALIGFAATIAAAAFGYLQTRSFVRRRLAYVNAAHGAGVPIMAGLAAAVLATPVVALLPLVGLGTAIVFGVAVGAGVSAGSRDTRQRRLGA
jgi:hypothetical protein